MSIDEIFTGITGGGGIIVLLMTLIQIAPVAVNPWSGIAKWIRRTVYGPVEDEIRQLGDKITAIDDKSDMREASNSRYRILRFNDEVLQGKKHTKEHFDQILDDMEVYEDYCREHPKYENNKAVMAAQNIKAVYQKCAADKSFL